MAVELVPIHNHLVMRDDALTHRWYDAFGPNVAKYVTSFTSLPIDDQTSDPTEFIVTVVEVGGTSSAVMGDVAGGALTVTCAGNEDDGWSMQLGNANTGEWCSFAHRYPTYFGIQLQSSDADQTDFFAGVAVTDTAILGGVTDSLGFRSVDESATINFMLEKGSVESTVAVATMGDAADITLEFLYLDSNIYAYVNGVLATTIADTDVTFPNTELMRLSFEFLSGEAVANTCQVRWLRLIQIQE